MTAWMRTVAVLSIALFVSDAAIAAGESASTTTSGWPTIRGLNHDGISTETGLANEWPDSGPPVLWVRELGAGYSSFVASGNRVYTQYQNLRGQFVICLDAETGETIWQYRYDWPCEPGGLYPGPRSTPTLANANVYFSSPKGVVACLDDKGELGELLWEVNLKEDFDGQGTDFGYACSPTIVENKVVMPVGGKGAGMVALDAKDGSVIWKSGSAPASYTPAMPIVVDGHAQVLGYMQNALISYDLATGDELWQLRLSKTYDEHAAWPVFRDPFLWFSGPFRSGSQWLRISGGPDADYERVRETPVMSNDVASSVLYDGYVYGFDLHDIQSKAHRPSRGSFRCIDFETGEEQWSNGDPRKRLSAQDGPTVGHASLIVADGKLVLFNDRGELILARATPEKYEELGRVAILQGKICWTTPMLHQRRLYVRNHSQAVCLYLGTDKSVSQQLTVRDIPQSTTRDFSHVLGVEPEYAMDPPTWKWLRSWYLASLVIFSVAFSLALLSLLVIKNGEDVGGSGDQPAATRVFWAVAFCLGIAATKPLSEWQGDFVLTWPVSLYAVFHATTYRMRLRKSGPFVNDVNGVVEKPFRDRLQLLAFVLTCGFYYGACRIVSLVTEWVFLCGFPAAFFVLVAVRWLRGRRWFESQHPARRLLYETCLFIIGFTLFFWSAVALLSWKYKILRA